MARNLFKTAGQALRNGNVSKEIREERYDTCKRVLLLLRIQSVAVSVKPMEAKSWVGGNLSNSVR